MNGLKIDLSFILGDRQHKSKRVVYIKCLVMRVKKKERVGGEDLIAKIKVKGKMGASTKIATI